jgi:hypothetical protein
VKARLLDVKAAEWASILLGTPHDFYHLPGYVALCAAQELGEPGALHVVDGERSMLLPLVIRDIPGSDGSDALSPYGYAGPLVGGTDDPQFLRAALVAGLSELRAEGFVSAFVRLHPLLNAAPPDGIGTVVRHGETVSIDLTLQNEALWAQTRADHRHDITGAVQLGYVARMDEEWRHLESFKQMYRATMARRMAAPFYFFSDAYFDGLRDALGGSLHLCVVEKDGIIAAAGLFVETNGIVQYHLSGMNDAFRRVRPTKLMIHFVRSWAKERGDRYLHLGGGVGGADDSLLLFKAGFSSLRRPFWTWRAVINEAEYRRLVIAHDPSADPQMLEGFFPQYRAA